MRGSLGSKSNYRFFKLATDRRKNSQGADHSGGSINVGIKKKPAKGAVSKIYINKTKFSKDKLSVHYSPTNFSILKKGLPNSRAQNLKRKQDFSTNSNKSSVKPHSKLRAQDSCRI
jgi:hypothetical protein